MGNKPGELYACYSLFPGGNFQVARQGGVIQSQKTPAEEDTGLSIWGDQDC